jgi:hypothetical protein
VKWHCTLVASVLALLCACRESDHVAQTIVLLDAEPAAQAAMPRVTIQVIGPGGNRLPTLDAEPPTWPMKFVVAPKNDDPSRRFTLHIEAHDAQHSPLVTFRFKTGFVANQTRAVKLLIHDACVQLPREDCGADRDCSIWDLELAASELGRSEDAPRTLDVKCVAGETGKPSESDASIGDDMTTGGMPQAGAPAAGSDVGTGTGTGTTAGSGAAGTTGPVGTTGSTLDCQLGYVRRGSECVDIDECETSSPCGDHGRCENGLGNYQCLCDTGYEVRSAACEDVDECQTNNGGCETNCVNSLGSAACTCASDDWLKADRKACGKFGAAKRLTLIASTVPTEPRFAFDASGNGLVVWKSSDGTHASLWSRRYVAGTGWAAYPAKLTISDTGEPSNPRIALDPKGRGVMVWVQTADSHSDIWAVLFDGQAFGQPAKIETDDAGSAIDPTIALDGTGNGFAAWMQSDGTHAKIWVNRLKVDTGWMGAQAIQNSTTEDAFAARLALDANGNATAVWTQSYAVDMQTTRFTAWAARFDAALGRWRSPTLLDDSGAAGFPDTQLFGAEGHALAVWPRLTDGRVSIRASDYSATTGWNDSINIALADSDITAMLPRVALTPSGNGAAIWAQAQTSGSQVWTNRYDVTSGAWTGAAMLRAFDSTLPPFPQLAIDPAGDGFGVWSEIQGTARVISAWRLQSDVGFVAGVKLSMDVTADPAINSTPQIAVDSQGNAVAVWDVLNAGLYETWANRFE